MREFNHGCSLSHTTDAHCHTRKFTSALSFPRPREHNHRKQMSTHKSGQYISRKYHVRIQYSCIWAYACLCPPPQPSPQYLLYISGIYPYTHLTQYHHSSRAVQKVRKRNASPAVTTNSSISLVKFCFGGISIYTRAGGVVAVWLPTNALSDSFSIIAACFSERPHDGGVAPVICHRGRITVWYLPPRTFSIPLSRIHICTNAASSATVPGITNRVSIGWYNCVHKCVLE